MTAREKEARYWEKRRLADKRQSINRAEKNINRQVRRMYQAAIKEIQAEIENLYQSFANQEGITLLEAKKRLSKADFKEIDFDRMIQETAKERKQLKAEGIPDDLAAAIERRLREQEQSLKELSRKGYLTHLELMQAQIERTALEVGNEQQVNLYQLLDKEYRDGYFRGIFHEQQWLGFGKDFVSPDPAAVKKAVMQSWAKDHFSDRIWGGAKKLSQELKKNLTIGLIRGEGVEEMTKRLTRRIEVSASYARRLVRTESAYICGVRDHPVPVFGNLRPEDQQNLPGDGWKGFCLGGSPGRKKLSTYASELQEHGNPIPAGSNGTGDKDGIREVLQSPQQHDLPGMVQWAVGDGKREDGPAKPAGPE